MNQTKSILLVDDDQTTILLTQLFLESMSLKNVHASSNGQEAIDFIHENCQGQDQSNCPDLVLLDLKLPDINGLDVLQKIRSSDINTNVPVIAQTAYAMSGDAKKSINAGCDDYISKPIDIEELQEKIKKLISA